MAKKSRKKSAGDPLPISKPASTAAQKWYESPRNQAIGLFLFAFLLYANTLGHDFTVDDAIVITNNSLVQKGAGGIGEIFAYDTFYGFFEDESKANLVAGGRYRPLTLAMFAIEQQLSPGPFISHLFNVVWYGALLAVLLYFVRGLLRGRGYAWWLPLLIVGLFAAHPIHTEAVANIKGRDEIVALFFAALSAWLVWKAARDRKWSGAAAGAVCMGLGCLAKETAFTYLAVLPATVLLFPRMMEGGERPGGKPEWVGLKYTLPAIAAAALYLMARATILPAASGQPILELMNNPFVEWWNGIWRGDPPSRPRCYGELYLVAILEVGLRAGRPRPRLLPGFHSPAKLGEDRPVAGRADPRRPGGLCASTVANARPARFRYSPVSVGYQRGQQHPL